MTVNSLRLPFGQFALLASTELQQQGQKSVVNRTIYIRKLKLGVLLVKCLFAHAQCSDVFLLVNF